MVIPVGGLFRRVGVDLLHLELFKSVFGTIYICNRMDCYAHGGH